MKRIIVFLAICGMAGGSSACSSPSPSETELIEANPPGTAASRLAAVDTVSVGAGYFHSFARSRFHLGSNPVGMTHLGLNKVVGDEGSFAVDPRNGSSRAILNATAPTLVNFKPMTTDGPTHNARTVEYFKAAGIPAAQIGDARALPSMQGGTDARGNQIPPMFTGYVTEVYRVVAGINVRDSHAWASFDANGDVVQEAVHWPDIPDSVIKDALALQSVLADDAQLHAFKDRLPAEAREVEGEVAIRHGSTAEQDPAPFASYDVFIISRGNRGGVHHFDVTGREIQHPSSKVRLQSAMVKP